MADEKWRERAIGMIKAYPHLEKEEKALRTCSVTSRVTGMPGGGGSSRKVESAALRELPKEEARQLRSVAFAIKCTKRRYDNSEERLKIIDLIYWQRSHDLQGAAMKVCYSYDTVQDWHAEFIKTVDAFYMVL